MRYIAIAFVGKSDLFLSYEVYSYGLCRGVRPVSECAVRLALHSISRQTAALEATRLLRLGRQGLCCHRGIVMAYIVMAYIFMAYMFMASRSYSTATIRSAGPLLPSRYIDGLYSYGLYS